MPDDKDRELERLRRWRRDLHRIPELDVDLPETLAYVRAALDALSCEVVEPCESCLVARFDLGRGRATALRTDMDATVSHTANELERVQHSLQGVAADFETYDRRLEELIKAYQEGEN